MKNDTRELIKEKASKLFFSYGLKSISMDDIANELGISKKTIYQFFDDKKSLVHEVVGDLIRSHNQLFETSRLQAHNAIDEVLKQDSGGPIICKNLRLTFFIDLEKLFPEVWKELEQYKLKAHKAITDNLRRGREEGFYRDDINLTLNSDLRLEQLINILKPELVHQVTVLYLRSITTDKGRKLLNKYLNEKSTSN